MENTKIVFRENAEIQLISDNEIAGRMDVSVADGMIRVYHTQVNPAYRGRGFSKLLLHQLVDYAREHKLRIIPLCPYVIEQLKRHPNAYGDLWESNGFNN